MIADADAAIVATQILWDVLLVVVVAVIVPVVLVQAAKLIRNSRAIRTHFKTTLAAAAEAVGNTAPTTPALNQTIDVATAILGTAGQIDAHSAAIEGLMAQRARTGGTI